VEYAEWAGEGGRTVAGARGRSGTVVTLAARESARAPSTGSFRILSPRDGDVYRFPPGVDPRYATIALRAAGGGAGGGAGDGAVRWEVDGRAAASRWALAPGAHTVVAARGAGERDTVRISVVP
jgi:hypothetical protein